MSKSWSTASAEIPQPVTLSIVEANAVFREFEAGTLNNCCYTVLKASGMPEALKLAVSSAAIHILLTEFPKLSPGFSEHTQQFCTIHPAAPVLLVLEALEAFDHGEHNLRRIGVMAKPFTLAELIDQSPAAADRDRCTFPARAKSRHGACY